MPFKKIFFFLIPSTVIFAQIDPYADWSEEKKDTKEINNIQEAKPKENPLHIEGCEVFKLVDKYGSYKKCRQSIHGVQNDYLLKEEQCLERILCSKKFKIKKVKKKLNKGMTKDLIKSLGVK